jgi:CheY-like chemotaxis protein
MVGIALRRSLLDAIESMRPPPGTASTSKVHQKYRILEMRYVEEIEWTEIQRRLAMSKTEYYREHGQALAAVTSALLERATVGAARKPVRAARPATPTELAEQEAREICARMQLELLDVRDTIREVVDTLDPLCRRRGVDLRLQPDPVPRHTQADRVGLRQALLNVIQRVMDAVAPGRVDVRILSRTTVIGIEIQGIPSAPRSPAPPLDLTVAQRLIEGLRGRVEVDSGDQVIVEVSLPTTRRSRILVVDNNQDFVALVSRYLNQENWEVIGAPDAPRAHQVIESSVPDLVLLDVLMPGCDGWEFLHQLKSSSRTSETPVVVCSVLNDEQLAIALGADGYLLKPLTQDDLVQALRPWQTSKSEVG